VAENSESGTPWWARSIKYYGPLVVMCFLLIGVITGLIPTSIKDAWADVSVIKAQQVYNRNAAAAEHQEIRSTLQTGNQLLRGICYGVNRSLSPSEVDQLCNH
jgi:hypothetical protein